MMIPLCLVTGFLGSGKTTLLRRFVGQLQGARVVYLINEFAPTDVDGKLLDIPPDQCVSVPGGSIFCRCLVTDFIRHLSSIAQRHAHELTGVIIEASGIADPAVVQRMLHESRLDQAYCLRQVIAIVDPDTLHDLLETLPNMTAQIRAANVIIINKTDRCAPADVERATRLVQRLNGHAVIHSAVRCEVPTLQPFEPGSLSATDGDYAICADPNYGRLRIMPASNLRRGQLQEALEAARPLVYRIKGFARIDDQLIYVDVSRAGVELQPTVRDSGDTELVCIYPPDTYAEVRAVLARLADPAPSTG